MRSVKLEITESGTVLIEIRFHSNMANITRDEAIADFAETWDTTVEPLRDRLTEISRQREADGNETNDFPAL